MFCSKCGKEVPDGAAFCPSCGTSTNGATPSKEAMKEAVKEAASAAALDGVFGTVGKIADKFDSMTGGEGHVELKFGNFFDSVFKKHDSDELDELFACGSPATTPAVEDISKEWPHPWAYSRVFVVLLATYVLLWMIVSMLGNAIAYPGLWLVAAMMVPFPVVVFFFETNAPRNVNFVRVIEIFAIGGALSVLSGAFFGDIAGAGTGDLAKSLLTGIVEELAKALTVAFFLNRMKGRVYILTGLLIGSAVGAGFAVFETAGYAYAFGVSYGTDTMYNVILLRSILAVGGHVAWGAVEGGALAICDEGEGFKLEHLWSPKFLPFWVVCIALHCIWDADIAALDGTEIFSGLSIKYFVIIFAVWLVILILLQRGIKQVNKLSEPVADKVSA